MKKEYIEQWGLILLDAIFEVVREESTEKMNKDTFYEMIAPEGGNIISWKYRNLMFGEVEKSTRKIYERVSVVLREKVKLEQSYANFEKTIKLFGINESEIERYIDCINRSEAIEKSSKRKWEDASDEEYAMKFKEKISISIKSEIDGEPSASPVYKIAVYFKNRRSFEEEEALKYENEIKNFIEKYKDYRFLFQYMKGEELENCAKYLLEMANDMRAVKKYKEIVQKRVRKKG